MQVDEGAGVTSAPEQKPFGAADSSVVEESKVPAENGGLQASDLQMNAA